MSAGEARIHDESIPRVQRDALSRLGGPVTALDFYMAGGTALALQLGHRLSVDFDWFRAARIDDPIALAAELGIDVLSTSRDTLHGSLDGVKASFFTYAYPLLEPLVPAAAYRCKLASMRDIAAMKLAAIAQRGSRKDYYDLVAIGRAGLGLGAMLAAYREKFAVRDAGHVLVALTWFDDADQDPEPMPRTRDDWAAIKATLGGWVKDLANA